MNLHFFDISGLEKELRQLPPLHRVAFAASICERILPNYNAFSRMENWGDPSVPRKALDEIWQILAGKPADVAKVRQLREDCSCEDVLPDSDEFYDSYYILEAQEAIFAICSTLLAYIDSDLRNIIWVVKNARFNTIELFICARDKLFNASQYKDDKDKLVAIANHPLAVREMTKENEDLERLKEMKTLDRDFLEWLRTSFDNDGKSIIDVS
ncbi:DUF416 family protein [Argonema antarcticum]|uniref:DUF416 family protein n=1 Tax=Argonema antarcticum TaxID=2942763 RepID=UPI0020120624|nr:DUF416 family protein [Argonema antarcticum]MCL1474697.1 YjaG family protein [Argonema antarcticum A004/B2]